MKSRIWQRKKAKCWNSCKKLLEELTPESTLKSNKGKRGIFLVVSRAKAIGYTLNKQEFMDGICMTWMEGERQMYPLQSPDWPWRKKLLLTSPWLLCVLWDMHATAVLHNGPCVIVLLSSWSVLIKIVHCLCCAMCRCSVISWLLHCFVLHNIHFEQGHNKLIFLLRSVKLIVTCFCTIFEGEKYCNLYLTTKYDLLKISCGQYCLVALAVMGPIVIQFYRFCACLTCSSV